jgi:hypothetical protein
VPIKETAEDERGEPVDAHRQRIGHRDPGRRDETGLLEVEASRGKSTNPAARQATAAR